MEKHGKNAKATSSCPESNGSLAASAAGCGAGCGVGCRGVSALAAVGVLCRKEAVFVVTSSHFSRIKSF